MDRFARAWVVMAALMAGCSKSSSPPPEAAQVDLQPLTVSFRGQPIARLFSDGRTESAGPNAPGGALVPGPTLHADGTMVMTRAGVTARLDEKGDIYVLWPSGESSRRQLFGRITGDQLSMAGSAQPWSVRVRGNMIEFGPENTSQLDGEVTPSMRHAALVMAAAFSIDGAIPLP
jgi:hypothetical protein